MGNLHKLLIVSLAHTHFLLPKQVLADDQYPDPLAHQQINNATAGRVQIAVYPAIALRRNSIQMARSKAVLVTAGDFDAGRVVCCNAR